MIQNEN